MVTIRPATTQELGQILPLGMPGYEVWCALAVDDQGRWLGHICLSRALGKVIGHDWACWDTDPHTATRLVLAARKQLRAWRPDERLSIHFRPDDKQTVEFWTRIGFQPVMTLYER